MSPRPYLMDTWRQAQGARGKIMKHTHILWRYFKIGGCCIALLTAISLTLLSTTYSSTDAVKKSETVKPSLSKHEKYAELTCEDCHPTKPPKPVTTKQCLSCHGSLEEVAGMTRHLDPNPHNPPHYGTGLDCDLCHHEHFESENFCSQCHEWKLVIP